MNSVVKIITHSSRISRNLNAISSTRRLFCTEAEKPKPDIKEGGYAKAFKKFEKQLEEENKTVEENLTFSALLRNSNFIDVSMMP